MQRINEATDTDLKVIEVVRNRGTTSVFIGAAAVTTATGYELEAGDAVGLELRVNEVIYGIVASGTARVDVAQNDAEPLLG